MASGDIILNTPATRIGNKVYIDSILITFNPYRFDVALRDDFGQTAKMAIFDGASTKVTYSNGSFSSEEESFPTAFTDSSTALQTGGKAGFAEWLLSSGLLVVPATVEHDP